MRARQRVKAVGEVAQGPACASSSVQLQRSHSLERANGMGISCAKRLKIPKIKHALAFGVSLMPGLG